MRYAILWAALCGTCQAQSLVASYDGGNVYMGFPPQPGELLRIKLFYGPSWLINDAMTFDQLQDGATFAIDPPPQVGNGQRDNIDFWLFGVTRFDESRLDYHYPHYGADFRNEALITEMRLTIDNVVSLTDPGDPLEAINGAHVRLDFYGHKLAAVPEPASWVMGLVGLLLACCIKVQLNRRLRQAV
jgi:hypothetical protein